MRSFLAIILMLLTAASLFSQRRNIPDGTVIDYWDQSSIRVGLMGNYRLVNWDASFKKLPGVPNCCPDFKGGDANGYGLGLFVEHTLSESIHTSLRFQYHKHKGEMISSETTLVLVNDEITEGLFEHQLESDFTMLAFEALMSWNMIADLKINFGIAFESVSSGTYKQKEVLVKPEDEGVFADTETRERNVFSGDIPDLMAMNIPVFAGVSYDLPLNKDRTFFLSPGIAYYHSLGNIVKDIDWKIHSLSIGLGLKYDFRDIPEPAEMIRDTLIEVDTVTVRKKDIAEDKIIKGSTFYLTKLEDIERNNILESYIYKRIDTLLIAQKPNITGNLDVFALENGRRSKANEIKIIEQFVTQAFHFLPYMFFDENSHEISERYEKIDNHEDFSIDELAVNPVLYQEHILNILGERLEKHPKASITLMGYADPTTEQKNSCIIANKRAGSIKNYLKNVWNIEESRIIIPAEREECFPGKLTVTKTEKGFSENRRVDIIANDPEILAPISRRKFLEVKEISPEVLVYDFSLKGESMLVKNVDWELTAKQELKEKELFLTNDQEKNEDIKELFDREYKQVINDIFAQKAISGKELKIELKAGSENAIPFTETKYIKITKDTTDFEYERLSLAFFDVSGTDIREIDKAAIRSFVQDLKPTDTVKVYGYTDELGDPKDNLYLARMRAANVCNYIKSVLRRNNVKVSEIECKGVGFSSKPPQIRSYDTPEERFLSRTVLIEIRRKWR